MLKKILAIIALLYAAASFAAVEANTASAAELDGIKGIGPGLSGRIIEERKSGDFKDWSDFIGRVSGVGDKTAARFSKEGLTVNGKKFGAAAAAKKADAAHRKHAGSPASAKPSAATEAAPAQASSSATAPQPPASTGKN